MADTARVEPPPWAPAVLRGLYRLEAGVAILGFAVITGALFIDLLGREFFGRGVFGAQRVATYAMVVVAFLGFALAVGWRAHLGIEVADRLTPKAWDAVMERLSDFVAAAGCIFLAYWSWRFVAGSFREGSRGQALNLIEGPFQAILVWCFASSALRHLAFGLWPALRPPKEEPAE